DSQIHAVASLSGVFLSGLLRWASVAGRWPPGAEGSRSGSFDEADAAYSDFGEDLPLTLIRNARLGRPGCSDFCSLLD
ncbi:MAG: hypothetical protein V3T64_15475, partial [Myxococcota bacterium]